MLLAEMRYEEAKHNRRIEAIRRRGLATISEVILAVTQLYLDLYDLADPAEINRGMCEDFANAQTEEVKASLSEMRLGRSRADALRSMAMRVRVEQLTTTVTAVVQAERLGSNLRTSSKNWPLKSATTGRNAAEELANMMPTKMAIPMALFMLPALFVMIFGGVAANYVGK